MTRYELILVAFRNAVSDVLWAIRDKPGRVDGERYVVLWRAKICGDSLEIGDGDGMIGVLDKPEQPNADADGGCHLFLKGALRALLPKVLDSLAVRYNLF